MNLYTTDRDAARRTNADDVFDVLRDEIVSLTLVPGTKLSEADLARRFGVSRQPVREALIRLNDQKLVMVRPQQATVVCKISGKDILHSRFIRIAVEVEIAQLACERFGDRDEKALARNLEQQAKAVAASDYRRFNTLDYRFHRLLCISGGAEFAYQTIAASKLYVERLCMLELADPGRFAQTYHDHVEIFRALKAGDKPAVVAATRLHLSRLNDTLRYASEHQPDYFED